MRRVYSHYGAHFLRLNPSTKGAFESVAKSYAVWHKRFLPSNKDAKNLDVGCGMGHFLYFLKSEGYTNFFGMDISKQQVDFVKENLTKNVVVADTFEFLRNEEKCSFQLIVMNDVIEHIHKENLLDLLYLISDSLEDGGKFFIKTDNMSNPFGLRGRHMDITHEICFTEHSLFEVLNTVGFQNIHLMGASPPALSLKSAICNLGKTIVHKFLKFMFSVQGYPPPKILDKDIIAIAVKK